MDLDFGDGIRSEFSVSQDRHPTTGSHDRLDDRCRIHSPERRVQQENLGPRPGLAPLSRISLALGLFLCPGQTAIQLGYELALRLGRFRTCGKQARGGRPYAAIVQRVGSMIRCAQRIVQRPDEPARIG